MTKSTSSRNTKGQPGLFQAALFGMCPHCGARTLFEAPAQIAGTCSQCGQELARLERGGRLAGLLTIIIAVVLSVIAFAVDDWLKPPIWLFIAVLAPVTISSVLYTLRLFKAASVFRQYQLEQGEP